MGWEWRCGRGEKKGDVCKEDICIRQYVGYGGLGSHDKHLQIVPPIPPELITTNTGILS